MLSRLSLVRNPLIGACLNLEKKNCRILASDLPMPSSRRHATRWRAQRSADRARCVPGGSSGRASCQQSFSDQRCNLQRNHGRSFCATSHPAAALRRRPAGARAELREAAANRQQRQPPRRGTKVLRVPQAIKRKHALGISTSVGVSTAVCVAMRMTKMRLGSARPALCAGQLSIKRMHALALTVTSLCGLPSGLVSALPISSSAMALLRRCPARMR